MLPVGKFQARRSLMKILAEQFTEQAARRNESIPVVHEMESVRTRFLFRRKSRLQSAENFFFAVERRVPNVDFIPDLIPFHFRHCDSHPGKSKALGVASLGTPISRLAAGRRDANREIGVPG